MTEVSPDPASASIARRYRRRRAIRAAAGCAAILNLLAAGCTQEVAGVTELRGNTMGTTYSVQLAPPPNRDRLDGLQQQIEQRLKTVNAQMSTYIADSALSQFNRSLSLDWHSVPAPVAELVHRANRISELSAGRYDVTLGPLIELWGFGGSGRRTETPSNEQITAALATVGYYHVQTRQAPPGLRKSLPRLKLDLSSIAKGWAVDQLAVLLVEAGFDNYLIEIGGDLFARGDKGRGQPWRVAVERPGNGPRQIYRTFEIRDAAVATSGDYRNFFAVDGQHYSHTLDPLTGRPVRDRLAAVTVVAGNATDADAWATALLALGEHEGPQLADKLGIKALFIIRTEDGLVDVYSHPLQLAQASGALGPPTQQPLSSHHDAKRE